MVFQQFTHESAGVDVDDDVLATSQDQGLPLFPAMANGYLGMMVGCFGQDGIPEGYSSMIHLLLFFLFFSGELEGHLMVAHRPLEGGSAHPISVVASYLYHIMLTCGCTF